jgi:hypothetical protein
MNFWTRIYKPVLLILAAAFFCLAGQMQSRLNVDRKSMGLTKLDPLQNAPPVLAFTTVALGGFRGLIANALWMRLSDLQNDDKYFEMVQLADWITKLQPHMVAVWQYQAWNMAYNISVKFKSHEDRWQWVLRGIQLLRDDGLKYNPNETRIYRDLSWLFQHKMGANLDDAHMTYKLHWAQMMQEVLGGRPDFKELENPTTPEWKERARQLREVYKMDPKIVEQVDKAYGPFDWRLPDAHAVYWAELGRIYGRAESQETLRRSVYQTMQQMGFRGGSLSPYITNWTRENFVLRPNLDQIPTISASYERMIAEETNNPQGLQQNMETAHKNFLKQAIYLLYEDGREKDAQHWFTHLKTIYTNAFVGKEANISLENFAVSQIITDNNETDQDKVEASILGMFDNEFLCLITDNDDQAINYDNMAKKIWKHYNDQTVGASKERLELKSIAQLRQYVLDRLMNPNGGLSPRARAILKSKLNLPAEQPKPAPAAPAPAPAT